MDLASDASACFGDNDALACYMLPLDVAFLVLPVVPGVAPEPVPVAGWPEGAETSAPPVQATNTDQKLRETVSAQPAD